ncbi:MAG: hypothetical protein UHS47_02040, partial [Oscillospiraceae bacterium]|nr:hypothetical protein [Oscillospiraceae bacterium]
AADFESATSTISSHRQVCISFSVASRRWLFIVAALRRQMSPSFAVPDAHLGVNAFVARRPLHLLRLRLTPPQAALRLAPADFESATSTISSHRQVCLYNLLT